MERCSSLSNTEINDMASFSSQLRLEKLHYRKPVYKRVDLAKETQEAIWKYKMEQQVTKKLRNHLSMWDSVNGAGLYWDLFNNGKREE